MDMRITESRMMERPFQVTEDRVFGLINLLMMMGEISLIHVAGHTQNVILFTACPKKLDCLQFVLAHGA